jgi:hypothetical protein
VHQKTAGAQAVHREPTGGPIGGHLGDLVLMPAARVRPKVQVDRAQADRVQLGPGIVHSAVRAPRVAQGPGSLDLGQKAPEAGRPAACALPVLAPDRLVAQVAAVQVAVAQVAVAQAAVEGRGGLKVPTPALTAVATIAIGPGADGAAGTSLRLPKPQTLPWARPLVRKNP